MADSAKLMSWKVIDHGGSWCSQGVITAHAEGFGQERGKQRIVGPRECGFGDVEDKVHFFSI